MSKRLFVSALAGAVVLGGGAAATVALVGTADAAGPTGDPVIGKSSSAPVVLGDGGTDALTFTTSVSDDSGIRSVKVLAWPRSSHLAPKASEMASVESATCRASSATTSVCTYRAPADGRKDAAGIPTGTWYVAVLVTAEDHGTMFSAKASTFTVTRHAD
ncbi:DUF5707 domain-containing protein [Streptomyces sp. NPDC006333]|uniref:DUF5707 domain-containing protein n=1 Tax=Streptomyces sp. NPDC006333 TaxID=3156753 RepID=UPI0033B6BE53